MIEHTHLIASSAIVPVRREASDTSEMVTQMLLGESALILSKEERWVKVCCDFDKYIGWISIAQCFFLTPKSYHKWTNNFNATRSSFKSFTITNIFDNRLIVPTGSLVEVTENTHIKLPFGTFTTQESLSELSLDNPVSTALEFLGVPYLWGGRSLAGIDCSGLIQLVYLLHNIHIPRDASQQEQYFKKKSNTIMEAKYGDLFFFKNEKNHVFHVGFSLGNGEILHASGNVKIETLNHTNDETNRAFNSRLSDTFCGVYELP